MAQNYNIEMWLKADGNIVSKIEAAYPGENTFFALLNFIDGLAKDKEAVKALSMTDIDKIKFTTQKTVYGKKFGKIQVIGRQL